MSISLIETKNGQGIEIYDIKTTKKKEDFCACVRLLKDSFTLIFDDLANTIDTNNQPIQYYGLNCALNRYDILVEERAFSIMTKDPQGNRIETVTLHDKTDDCLNIHYQKFKSVKYNGKTYIDIVSSCINSDAALTMSQQFLATFAKNLISKGVLKQDFWFRSWIFPSHGPQQHQSSNGHKKQVSLEALKELLAKQAYPPLHQ